MILRNFLCQNSIKAQFSSKCINEFVLFSENRSDKVFLQSQRHLASTNCNIKKHGIINELENGKPENVPSFGNCDGEEAIVHLRKRGLLIFLEQNQSKEQMISNCSMYFDTKYSNPNARSKLSDKYLLSLTKKKALFYDESHGSQEISKKQLNPVVGELPINPIQWRSGAIDLKQIHKYYASLSKSRLTGLVVLTCAAGYILSPGPFVLQNFLSCTVGTALVSSCANTINQIFEVPFDSQMDRTKNRVLVRGSLTPLHAAGFGAICGLSGLGLLYFGSNGTAAILGALNLFLYTAIYTPTKRISIWNTWIGSVVGAIPPLMGWAACSGSLDLNALLVGAILFAWQFPHFNALSWNLQQDYSRAGYAMTSVLSPRLCKLSSLRYSAVILAIPFLAPIMDVTSWTFTVDSLPPNLYLLFLAGKFYRDGDSKSSRNLFRFSLIHLPVVLVLMIISRKPSNYEDGNKSGAFNEA